MNNNLFERNKRMAELGSHIKDIVTGKINLFSNDNNSNFFESAIANFVSKMENSLESAGSGKYKFNIESNKGLIKDILFIGAYVKKMYYNNEQSNSSTSLPPDFIISYHCSNFETHFNINKYYLYDSSNATLKVNGNGLSSVNGTNMISLENQINNSNNIIHFFLQSLKVCKSIRNIRSHQNLDDATFTLDDDSVKLYGIDGSRPFFEEMTIPLSYLSDFGKGIRADEKDTDIEEEVNSITNNIFFMLGYDLKEIPDFWYSVHPSRIKRLLEIFEPKDLVGLSAGCFTCNDETIEKVLEASKISESNTYDYELLKALPYSAYICTIKKLEQIKELVKISGTNTYDYELLKALPYSAYICTIEKLEQIKELVKISGTNTYDYELLKELPDSAYSCTIEKLEQIKEFVKKSETNTYDYELLKALPYSAYICTIEKFEQIKELVKISGTNTYDYELLKALPYSAYSCTIEKFEQIKELVKISGTNTYDYEFLKALPYEAYRCTIKKLEQIKELVKISGTNTYDYELLKELPDSAYSCTIKKLEQIKELVKISGTNTYDYEFLKALPYSAYRCTIEKLEQIKELVKKSETNTYDYELLKALPDSAYGCTIKKLEQIKELVKISETNTYDYEFLKALPYEAYRCTIKKLERIKELVKISETNTYDYELLKALPDSAYICTIEELEETIKLVKISETNTYDHELLKALPYEAYFCTIEKLERIKELVKISETNTYDYELLKALPYEVYICTIEKLERIKELVKISETNTYDYELLKALPHSLFTCRDEIFNYIIEKVGIVQIKRLPSKIFKCTSTSMVEQLLKDYGYIMMQSLFGIKNPKIVSLIVYMNALLTVYNPSQPTSMLNLEDLKIQFASPNNINQGVNIGYKGFNLFTKGSRLLERINDISNSSTNSINSSEELISAVKAAVIEQLRNCSAHFHIFEVDGEPDKVRLYHKHGGEDKFNYVISINLLFEILENIRIAETKKRIIDKFDDANSEYELCNNNNNINTDQVVKLICDYGLTIEENDPLIEHLLTHCHVLEDDKENYKREILVALQNRQNQISLDSTLENVHVEDNVVSTLKK